ncbi:MAG TPA: glycosyltransferase family 4 protein [Caulobacter sp.]|nr:glycosyltransferase family 4 protein [Caulobacter sp.]
MTGRSARPILFCATGVTGIDGGIASANRNVLAALEAVGAETGRAVQTLVLTEAGRDAPGYRTFGGDKLAFGLACLAGMRRAGLAVFDHVRLAVPMLALPGFLRPPSVICAHGSEGSWRLRPSSARAYRAADLVLANSNYTLGRMRSRIAAFNGVACPLGLPPQFLPTTAPPPPACLEMVLEAADGVRRPLEDRVLLLTGRMDAAEQEKGHRELLDILPELVARYPRTQLVLAGSGSDLEPLRTLARSSPVAGQVFLPGRVSTADLEGLYRKAYAFTMPSRQEGFGLAYLEAMNFAKPCLACHDDGGADVVVDGETGVLVRQPIERTELLEAIGRLLADPGFARRLGESGWRRLNQHFTSAAHQARVAGFVRQLLDVGAPDRQGDQ